jgi:hypothetical protein
VQRVHAAPGDVLLVGVDAGAVGADARWGDGSQVGGQPRGVRLTVDDEGPGRRPRLGLAELLLGQLVHETAADRDGDRVAPELFLLAESKLLF